MVVQAQYLSDDNPIYRGGMKVPIFIDTDLDCDDYIAILYALANDNFDVKGISITGCGAVYREKGIRYIARLLEITGRTDVPIFLGARTPLRYSNVFPCVIRHGANIAYGIHELLENPRECAVAGCAVDGIKNVLEKSEMKVNIVLLGGASTMGMYIQKGYSLENVESIFYSGGNILAEYLPASYAMYGMAGNVHPVSPIYGNKVAEYNVFVDAYATQLIIDSKVKTLFGTLSATYKGLYVCDDLAKKTKSIGTICASLISRVLDYMIKVPEFTPPAFHPIFDLNAIMPLICPESVTKSIKADARIELEFLPDDNDQLGRIIIQNINENSPLEFFLDLDKDLLEKKFLDGLKNL